MRVCGKTGCYVKVPDDQIACLRHGQLITRETRERIDVARARQAWGAHHFAIEQAIVELNGTWRPGAVDDATLTRWLKEGVLA